MQEDSRKSLQAFSRLDGGGGLGLDSPTAMALCRPEAGQPNLDAEERCLQIDLSDFWAHEVGSLTALAQK